MDFQDLYINATKLDQDFLRNEFGYDLGIASDNIVYKMYYNDMISAISDINVFNLCADEVEEWLETGRTTRIRVGESPISSVSERKYLFLMAQAKQLKYDRDNGRASMIRGEDGDYLLCKDTFDYLKRLGLVQNVRY